MAQTTPNTMHAVAIDRFGGLDALDIRTLPVPTPSSGQILIRVQSAGVGPWDASDREGSFAKMMGREYSFPYVLGFEGAGTVAEVGEGAGRFQPGDRVYGVGDQRGGFYAQYAVVDSDHAWAIPSPLTIEQAGAMPVDAATALRGLRDTLKLKEGETLLIFGASGGIGHIAIQLAKRMNVRVLAIASGEDGVELAKKLGADAAVDGHSGDIAAAARAFAPDGADAALITAGGEGANRTIAQVRQGGRAAYPNGVRPEPSVPAGVRGIYYNADQDAELMAQLNRLIEAGPFEVHIGRAFPLDQVAEAQRALDSHVLGRLALLPN